MRICSTLSAWKPSLIMRWRSCWRDLEIVLKGTSAIHAHCCSPAIPVPCRAREAACSIAYLRVLPRRTHAGPAPAPSLWTSQSLGFPGLRHPTKGSGAPQSAWIGEVPPVRAKGYRYLGLVGPSSCNPPAPPCPFHLQCSAPCHPRCLSISWCVPLVSPLSALLLSCALVPWITLKARLCAPLGLSLIHI